MDNAWMVCLLLLTEKLFSGTIHNLRFRQAMDGYSRRGSMVQLKGIVFDLDGTLIDSIYDLHKALNSTLQAHGRRSVTLDEFKAFYGDGMRFIVRRAFAATGEAFQDSEADKFFQEYLYRYRHQDPDLSQTYPGVPEMLEAFHKSKVRLGICSLKPEEATVWLLEQLGLRHFFTSIGGGDTFPVCKPNPGHLLGVMQRMGVPAAYGLMIGDGLKDVKMAHEAGVKCLLIDHDKGPSAKTTTADGVLYGFSEIKEALEKIGFEVA